VRSLFDGTVLESIREPSTPPQGRGQETPEGESATFDAGPEDDLADETE
jgi:hypothetical protein